MAIVVATLDVLIRADGSSFRRGLQEAENDIDRFSRRVSDKIKKVGRIMTAGLTLPIIAGFGLAIKAAVNFEDAFAGVRKTTEATEMQFMELSRALRDMATDAERPVSSLKNAQIELARIAEIAGQLGVPIDRIEQFTEVMGELALSTDISATQGALKLAQFINITDAAEIPVRQLADVIVRLGNNMAVTESTILLTAQRLAATGSIAGATAPELLGVAAAVAELGQTSSVGGTAMTKFFGVLIQGTSAGGPKLDAFARAAGLSAEEFVQAYEEDATSAILTFIAGLAQLENAAKLEVLDDLSIKGQRQVAVMLGLSQASERMALAQRLVSEEMAGGNALSIEAAKRAITTASQMNLLRNTMRDLGIEIGNILLPVVNEIVSGLTKFFAKVRDLNPEILRTGIVVAALIASLGPLIFIIGSLLNPIGLVIIGMGALVTAAGGLSSVKQIIMDALGPEVVTAIDSVADALTDFANILFPTGPEAEQFVFDPASIFGGTSTIEIPGITFSLPPGSNLNKIFSESEDLQTMFGTSGAFVKAFLIAFPELTTTTIPANTEFTLGAESVTITDTGGLADFKDQATGVGTLYGTTFGERLKLAFETVKPELTEAGIIIGNAILDGLGKLTEALPGFLMDIVLPAVIDVASELGQRIGKFILGGLKDKIQESGGLVGLADDFLLAFGVAFLLSSSFRGLAILIVGKLLTAIGAVTISGFSLGFLGTSFAAALTIAIGAALAVFTPVAIAAAIFLYFTNPEIKKQVDRAGQEIVDTLFGEGATKKIRDSLQKNIGDPLVDAIINLGNAFKGENDSTEAMGAFTLLVTALGDAFRAIKEGDILGFISGFALAIIGLGLSIVTLPLDLLGLLIEKLGELTGLEFLDVLGGWIQDVDNALIGLAVTVADWIKNSGILTQIASDFGALATAINRVISAIEAATGLSLPGFLGGSGGGAGSPVIPGSGQGGGGSPRTFEQNAMGGFLGRGQMSLVGERGPELFVPNSGGMIVPNNKLGGGGITIINPTFIGQSPHEALLMLERAMKDSGA